MKNPFFIRKGLAAIFLFVLALAIAPKQLLHDALATHKHHHTFPLKETKLTQSGFMCDCENLVAESVFLDFSSPIILGEQVEYSSFVLPRANFYVPVFHATFRLRGPPSSI